MYSIRIDSLPKYALVARLCGHRLRGTLAATLLVLFGSLPSALAETPVQLFAALPESSLATLSPSGRLVAFRSVTAERDAIVVFDLEENETLAVQPVGDADVVPTAIRFVTEDYIVMALRQVVVSGGARGAFEASIPQYIDLARMSNRRFVNRANYVYQRQQGLGRVLGVWTNETTVLTDIWNGHRDARTGDLVPTLDLFAVDLKADLAETIATAEEWTYDWLGHPSGESFFRHDHDPFKKMHSLWWDAGSGPELIFERNGREEELQMLGFTDAGETLLVGTGSRGRTERVIGIDLESQQTFDVLKGARVSATIANIDGMVAGFEVATFSPEYKFLDYELHEHVARFQDRVDAWSVKVVSWSEDYSRLLFLVEGKTTAGSYYLYDVESGEPRLLADQRPALKHTSIASTSFTSFTTRDDTVLPVTILTPHGMSDTSDAPIVVLVDSLPIGFPDRQFDWLSQAIADAGYIVIKPQFRGAGWTSNGSSALGDALWMTTVHTDIEDAVSFAASSGLGSGDDVCVVGRDFGGYAALAAGAFSGREYRCLVAINGFSDVFELGEIHRRHGGSGYPYRFPHVLIAGLGENYRIDQLDREASPIHHASNFDSRVLLVHSSPNPKIPTKQSKRMHRALKKARKDSKFVNIKNSDIWFSDAESRVRLLTAVRRFLDES